MPNSRNMRKIVSRKEVTEGRGQYWIETLECGHTHLNFDNLGRRAKRRVCRACRPQALTPLTKPFTGPKDDPGPKQETPEDGSTMRLMEYLDKERDRLRSLPTIPIDWAF